MYRVIGRDNPKWSDWDKYDDRHNENMLINFSRVLSDLVPELNRGQHQVKRENKTITIFSTQEIKLIVVSTQRIVCVFPFIYFDNDHDTSYKLSFSCTNHNRHDRNITWYQFPNMVGWCCIKWLASS